MIEVYLLCACVFVFDDLSGSKRLTDDGYTYNGRVNLESSDQDHAYGFVKINLHGTAKFVCLDGLGVLGEKARVTIGSSVCRQMGLTNGTVNSPTGSQ